MAIAALALWMITAAVGVFLLATSTRAAQADQPSPDSEPAPAAAAGARAAAEARAAEPAAPARDQFAPPSLQAAKSEPIPGMRALAEFSHPALAITGFGFWMAYTFIRDRVFAAIALGILLGAIAAGLSFAAANSRAARRAPGRENDALTFAPRVLIMHVAGAALTLLLAVLIAARV